MARSGACRLRGQTVVRKTNSNGLGPFRFPFRSETCVDTVTYDPCAGESQVTEEGFSCPRSRWVCR